MDPEEADPMGSSTIKLLVRLSPFLSRPPLRTSLSPLPAGLVTHTTATGVPVIARDESGV